MEKNMKSKLNNMKSKAVLQLTVATMLTIVGCVLLCVGFYAPPFGEIHSSVLVAFGEILTFVGALFGIDYHYRHTRNSN